MQIDIERLVSDPHRTATQLDRSTVFGLEEFVMLKAQRHRFSRRRERRLARRRVRCRPRSERSAKHAKRAVFQPGGKLPATARTDASTFAIHGCSHPSAATSAAQSARISSSISAGSETVRATSSRTVAKYCLRSRWMSVFTVPTPTPSDFAAFS